MHDEMPTPATANPMTDHRQPISEQDVLYVAELANLELTADERARMVKDLNSILDYVDRLNELDTSNVEPMAQTSDRYGIDESKSGSLLVKRQKRLHFAL